MRRDATSARPRLTLSFDSGPLPQVTPGVLPRFLGAVRAAGITIESELPLALLPIRNGEIVGPLDGLVGPPRRIGGYSSGSTDESASTSKSTPRAMRTTRCG